MPDYAKSDIQICQKACVLAGMNSIDDFEQQDLTEAVVLNTLYEDFVRDALSAIPWTFASFKKVLGAVQSTPPLCLYNAAYTLPSDGTVLRVKTVYVNGSVASYAIEENAVLVDALSTDEVVIAFTTRVPESTWPPFFVLYMIFSLAAMLSGAIARKADMAKAFEEKAERQLMAAKSRDSQQQTTTGLNLNRFNTLRRGGR
jgi:hypothetical protein